MPFSQVIGQEAPKRYLVRSVNESKVSHAQLFLGPEGSGNLALALAFAQFVNCENRSTDDSCGVCPSCLKAQKFIHPDIHFSFPFVRTAQKKLSTDYLPEWRKALEENTYLGYNGWIQSIDAENKQGNINIHECHDIIRRLNLKTFESEYKVLIMWLPEYMGKEGNTLLKLIEEPPEKTLIIMVASDESQILNTILSRTQLLKINKLRDAEIAVQLMAKNIGEEEALSISTMADGNYNEALRLIDLEKNDNENLLKTWLRACFKKDIQQQLNWVDDFAKLSREGHKNFLNYCLHFFRELLAIKYYPENKKVRLLPGELDLAQKLNPYITENALDNIATALDKAHYYIERNVNPKILSTSLSVQIANSFTKK